MTPANVSTLTDSNYDIPINYGIEGSSSGTFCADGAPTITFEYTNSSGGWTTDSVTGNSSSQCAPPNEPTFVGTAMPIVQSSGSPQAQIISITWELTGPNGPYQASG